MDGHAGSSQRYDDMALGAGIFDRGLTAIPPSDVRAICNTGERNSIESATSGGQGGAVTGSIQTTLQWQSNVEECPMTVNVDRCK